MAPPWKMPALMGFMGCIPLAQGFFSYIPPGHPGALRQVHSVGDSVSRGFAFLNKEIPLSSDSLLNKATLKKREVKVCK
jgi:hypothetical protein